MSANMIVFDAQYTSSQVKNLENARSALEEAISTLKKASAHEGWRCPEVRQISSSLDTINKKLGNLNQGMDATARALNNGMQRFQELESRSETQVQGLSNNLKSSNGFKNVSSYTGGEAITLEVTEIPLYTCPVIDGVRATFWGTKGDIPERIDAVLNYLKKRAGGAWGAILGFLTNGGAGIGDLWGGVKNLGSNFISNLNEMTTLPPDATMQQQTEKLCEIFVDFMADSGNTIENFADTVANAGFGAVKGWLKGMGVETLKVGNVDINVDELFQTTNQVWEGAKDVVKSGANFFIGIGEWLGDNVIKPALNWG